MSFQVYVCSISSKIISRKGMRHETRFGKAKELTDMPTPNAKRESQAFLCIMNYLGKLSSATVEVCKLLQQLTSVKMEWELQEIFDKAHYTWIVCIWNRIRSWFTAN